MSSSKKAVEGRSCSNYHRTFDKATNSTVGNAGGGSMNPVDRAGDVA